MASKHESRRLRAVILGGLGGVLVGYAVFSPAAMVFFHLSHDSINTQMMHEMQHSGAGAIRHAFSLDLPLWWIGFSVLGLVAGAVVGAAVGVLRHRRRKIEIGAQELATTNAKLREAYRQVIQANKLSSLGILSGTVIHDLNNHLTLIGLVVEGELDALSDSERPSSEWTRLQKHIRAMRALSGEVKRFSRKAAGERVPVDLHRALDGAVALTQRAASHKKVKLTLESSAARRLVLGDENELTQVFVNLIQNALDAMEEGGALRISTKEHTGKIEVRFVDTGPGIPVEVMPRIFEAFFTTKPEDKGTGLGLAICRQIIERHQDEISAHGNNGDRGATFRIQLPLQQESIDTGGVSSTQPRERPVELPVVENSRSAS